MSRLSPSIYYSLKHHQIVNQVEIINPLIDFDFIAYLVNEVSVAFLPIRNEFSLNQFNRPLPHLIVIFSLKMKFSFEKKLLLVDWQ